jgi:hypothetical protein
MQNLKISIVLFLSMVLIAIGVNAFAFDATANFSQAQPELVSGFFFKAGPTKGGPYPSVTDCGKPTPKADGTFDCVGKNFTANPVYGVVSNYDSAKKEIATSAEASLSITVQPPANLKMAMVVTTVSKITRRGNVVASTTLAQKEWTSTTREGTHGYRNKRGEYITTTIIAMN